MSTGKARYANPAAGAILNDRKKICLPQEANLFVEHPVFLFCFIAQHSAFHVVVQVVVFPIVQSYKFKSKSQQRLVQALNAVGVSDSSKLQIQKQITTRDEVHPFGLLVFPIVQSYKFKSKSQPL